MSTEKKMENKKPSDFVEDTFKIMGQKTFNFDNGYLALHNSRESKLEIFACNKIHIIDL